MEIIVTILIIIGAFVIWPFLCFILGWFTGWLIQITIGTSIVSGLALVGINIPLNQLPLFFGTLAIIASFFKKNHINSSDFRKSN